MSFPITDNMEFYSNPAFGVGKDPIPLDNSSRNELTIEHPVTGSYRNQGMANAPLAYNGAELSFDIGISPSQRLLPSKSYLRVRGVALNVHHNALTPVPIGVSIPWNSYAALIDTASYSLNRASNNVETYTSDSDHASMVKMTTQYSRTMLDSMHDSLFTPTIESKRDLNTGVEGAPEFSNETLSRRTNWLTFIRAAGGGDGNPIHHTKNLYLKDLFDSLSLPGAFYTTNFTMKLKFKAWNNILIVAQPAVPADEAPYIGYFITDVSLFLTYVSLSENQLAVEAEAIQKNLPVLRESFRMYDAKTVAFATSSKYRESNVKNLQAAVMLFPSTECTDLLGVNPYQYCYATDLKVANKPGISAYQMKYGETFSPPSELTIYPMPVDQFMNTALYANYRLVARRMDDKDSEPAIRAYNMCCNVYKTVKNAADNADVTVDLSSATMFASQFFPLNSCAHPNMNGLDFEASASGGSSKSVVVVLMRVGFLLISGNTKVYTID